MGLEIHLFQCTGSCQYWNKVPLDSLMEGPFIVQCGNCHHHHFRRVKKGVITEDRHNYEKPDEKVWIIEIPKSATSKEKPDIAKLQERGPLGSLWARFVK